MKKPYYPDITYTVFFWMLQTMSLYLSDHYKLDSPIYLAWTDFLKNIADSPHFKKIAKKQERDINKMLSGKYKEKKKS